MGIPDHLTCLQGFPGSSDGKASAYNAEDLGSIPMSGRSPGEGNGNPLQYSCLENPVDRGAWWAAAHRVTKSRARLSDFTSLHFTSLPASWEVCVQVKKQQLEPDMEQQTGSTLEKEYVKAVYCHCAV